MEIEKTVVAFYLLSNGWKQWRYKGLGTNDYLGPWGVGYSSQKGYCVLNNIAVIWVAHNSAVAALAFMISEDVQRQKVCSVQTQHSKHFRSFKDIKQWSHVGLLTPVLINSYRICECDTAPVLGSTEKYGCPCRML